MLEGHPIFTIDGRELASVGHRVSCPKCDGIFEIGPDLLGRDAAHQVMGMDTAVEGMRTTCGAILIASQSTATIGNDGDYNDLLTAGDSYSVSGSNASSALVTKQRCNHPDNAIPVATYIVAQMNENPFTEAGRKITAANSYDAAREAQRWYASPWNLGAGDPPRFTERAVASKALAYALWAAKVAPGGDWDHKPVIEDDFPTGKSLLLHKYQGFDYFYDIWSNIHYGYVGIAVGFTARELLGGAGLAQFGDDIAGNIVRGRRPSPQHHPSNGPWPNSADDIQDHTSIQLGIDLWSEVKPGAMTVDLLLERIAAVPTPWGAGKGAKRHHQCEHE